MKKAEPAEPRARIQVIARAADVLRALEDEEQGLSLGQIALRVGLPRSTVQRIVAALEAERFLVPVSAAGGVRLGPALLRLAASVNTAVALIARPLIVELSTALQETVDISAPRKDQAMFIDQAVGSQRLRTVSAVGESFPLYCTANGKAFLAGLEDAEIIRRIGRVYPARTPASHTGFASLAAELAQVRAVGYAIDDEEHALGIKAAGIVLADTLGNPLMVSVPVPAARFEARRDEIVARLLAMKGKLQERFGG